MNPNQNDELTLSQKLAKFISANAIIFIVFLVVLVGGLITLGVVDAVKKSNIQKSTAAKEVVEELLEDWIALGDDDEAKAELASEIFEKVEEIKRDFSGFIAVQEALFMSGQVHYENEEYAEAAAIFEEVGTGYDQSFITSVALMQAGIAYEQAEDFNKAYDMYLAISEGTVHMFVDFPRVLFSLGRLSEGKNDDEAALIYYNRILSDFETSSWRNFAQDRVIALTSR